MKLKSHNIALCSMVFAMLLFMGCDAQNKCGGTKGEEPSGDYVVQVYIHGEASSFEGRRIEVNGVQAKRMDCTLASDTEGCVAYSHQPEYGLDFCTEDKETFLRKPLEIVVYEGDRVVSTTSHERTECKKLSNIQDNRFVLTPEGTLKKDTYRDCDRICRNWEIVSCAEARGYMPSL